MNKNEKIATGRIVAYILATILNFFKKKYGIKDEMEVVNYLLDTKKEKMEFFESILAFILRKILALLTPKETKKISQKKLGLNTAKKIYESKP